MLSWHGQHSALSSRADKATKSGGLGRPLCARIPRAPPRGAISLLKGGHTRMYISSPWRLPIAFPGMGEVQARYVSLKDLLPGPSDTREAAQSLARRLVPRAHSLSCTTDGDTDTLRIAELSPPRVRDRTMASVSRRRCGGGDEDRVGEEWEREWDWNRVGCANEGEGCAEEGKGCVDRDGEG